VPVVTKKHEPYSGTVGLGLIQIIREHLNSSGIHIMGLRTPTASKTFRSRFAELIKRAAEREHLDSAALPHSNLALHLRKYTAHRPLPKSTGVGHRAKQRHIGTQRKVVLQRVAKLTTRKQRWTERSHERRVGAGKFEVIELRSRLKLTRTTCSLQDFLTIHYFDSPARAVWRTSPCTHSLRKS
jgi:hypothetical protein